MSAMSEGITRGARAGFWRRFVALFVDGIIVSVVSLILYAVIGTAAFRGLNALIFIVYLTYFEGTTSGQTIGKKLLGIRVYDHREGGASGIGHWRAFVRTLMRYVSAIPILLGYLWMLWDSEKQTWHDKVAGSVVVPVDQYPVASWPG
jgi:uncharacterized RDD family membrane protein YckC